MTTRAPHILVVDDHAEIRDLLGKYLERHGCRVSLAADGAAMRRSLRGSAIDLVVLDIMMPGEDGLALCRELRTGHATPVIFLTAMGEETDRVVGLELGADDYMVKPFNPRELLARIKAVLRRAHSLPPEPTPAPAGVLRFAGWRLAPARRELEDAAGVVTPLSSGEFALLKAFATHPQTVLSRDQLLDLTRGRAADIFDRSIDNQVRRLRLRIERDPRAPALIRTVRGAGYVFTPEVTRE